MPSRPSPTPDPVHRAAASAAVRGGRSRPATAATAVTEALRAEAADAPCEARARASTGDAGAACAGRRRRRCRGPSSSWRSGPARAARSPPACVASSTPPASSSTRTSAARRSPTAAVAHLAAVAARLLEPRIRPRRAARAGAATCTPRRCSCRLTGRRGRGRRQQQRRRDAAAAGGARRGPRGAHLARRARRDRRRVPRARHHGAVGRDPARGRHDQPDARRRLRGGRSSERTALILRVHPSNFRIEGFTERPTSRRTGGTRPRQFACPLAEDLGTGHLGLARRPWRRRGSAATSRRCERAWGRRRPRLLQRRQAARRPAGRHHRRAARDLVDRCAAHPLMRALRVDKLTYAALEATLARVPAGRAARDVPVARDDRARRADTMAARAERLARRLRARARAAGARSRTACSTVGGGSAPGSTAADASRRAGSRRLERRPSLERACARCPTPVIARIEDDRVVLDLRTVPVPEDRSSRARRAVSRAPDLSSRTCGSREFGRGTGVLEF